MHCFRSFRRTVLVAILSVVLPISVYAAEVTLGWDPPDDSRVTGYLIYYGISGTEYKSTPRMTIGSSAQTSTVISALEEGKTYVFAMTSTDADGNKSVFSDEITKTIPVDSDGDGVPDSADLCPNDPDKTEPGDCGCGVPDTDTDGDGIPDYNDTDDQDGTDPDSDGDGVSDSADLCPNDPYKTEPGDCGCGVSDTDTDGDGIPDCNDTDDQTGSDPPAEIPENVSPEAPILLSPPDKAIDMKRKVSLETAGFVDPDDDAHQATEWQISTRTDFSELVFAKKTDKNLTQLLVTHVVFAESQTYYWRARYFDARDGQSPWSEINEFTTGIWGRDKNKNGISDASEPMAATDLDGNGITDNDQEDMKTIQVFDADKQLGLKYSVSNAIEYIEGVDPLSIEDQSGKPDSVPFGLVNFRIKVDEPGQTVFVTVYLSEPAPEGARWFKYDDADGWNDYSSLAAFSSDRKSVELVLTDGGIGDTDGVENGVIVDPGGVGILADGQNTGSSSSGGSCFINSLY